jgi:hypothetical protein
MDDGARTMFHLNNKLLQSLLDGTVATREVQRIKRHVRECRACAGRLEEWSDNHPEVARQFPHLEQHADSAVTLTEGGLVAIPTYGRALPAWLRPRRLLWYGAGLLLVGVVARTAWLLRPQHEVMTVTLPDSALPPLRPPDPSTFEGNAPPPGDAVSGETTRPRRVEPLLVSEGFRAITGREAADRLGGPIRLLDGVDPDHFESGPPGAAPAAQRGSPLVRVVYRAPDDGRVYLDQQLIRADSTGFRPIDDPALENGDTVYRDVGGRRSATWLDDRGYLLTLSGPLSSAAIRELITRVR